jgi:hypothetical protein
MQIVYRVLWILQLCICCMAIPVHSIAGNFTTACIYSVMAFLTFCVVISNTDFKSQ